MTKQITNQISEQTLILYYYRDGLSVAECRDIEKALNSDESLRQRHEALTRDLDALADPDELPVPEGLEYRLQSNLARVARLEAEQALEQEQADSWIKRVFTARFLATGSALTAVLVVGVVIGVWMADGGSPQPQIVLQSTPSNTPQWSQAAFQRGLESHFRSGRSELADLSPQRGSDAQSLITSLITQNRLFEKLAIQNDAPEVARVLRSFEATLLQLASEDLSPQEQDELKTKLEFEYSVMLTKLARQASQQTETPNQEMKL